MYKRQESESTAIFTQDILIDTAQKRQALGEIEARHLEIMNLEQNIRELHEMFYDLAVLVEEQGEMIDRIEHNVENAAVHVDRGRKEIRTAVQYKKKNRRLRCCICVCVTSILLAIILVIGIIVAIVVVTQMQQQSGVNPGGEGGATMGPTPTGSGAGTG